MHDGEPFCVSATTLSPLRTKAKRSLRKEKGMETDEHRLQQRAKQIAYGENTPGYSNLMRVLETHPSLLKGSVPVKPSLTQRCSKRSWDGQIRKWRRALHMYDVVDFGDADEPAVEADAGRQASVEQTRNPLFRAAPGMVLPDDADAPMAWLVQCTPEVRLPAGLDPATLDRVQYSTAHLLQLANSSLVAPFIDLPEPLSFLDKRVDLEDDAEDTQDSWEGVPEQWLHRFASEWSALSASSSPSLRPTMATLEAVVRSPVNTSPSASIGHCDDSPLEALTFAEVSVNAGREAPWFPLEEYMPLEVSPAGGAPDNSALPFLPFKPRDGATALLFPPDEADCHGAPPLTPEAISYFTAPEDAGPTPFRLPIVPRW
eukprot:GGOE01003329.1.p1 GENE.GGOE01003329.1~~GGOE01003329.1.p1  ORF type:complete len:389 (-),score=95.45 GGOE01003329.1:864-1982(-)